MVKYPSMSMNCLGFFTFSQSWMLGHYSWWSSCLGGKQNVFPSYVFILLFTLSPQSPIESQANQPAAQLSCAFLSLSPTATIIWSTVLRNVEKEIGYKGVWGGRLWSHFTLLQVSHRCYSFQCLEEICTDKPGMYIIHTTSLHMLLWYLLHVPFLYNHSDRHK